MKILYKILLLIFLCVNIVSGQIRTPVEVITTLTPPYSPFMNDYYETGSIKLMSTLTFKDFAEPDWDVRFKLTIEGDNGIILVTKPEFVALHPFNLIPGVPKIVKGEDWAEYFNYDNMDITGIDPIDFAQNGVLPEGYYTICVEVLDYQTGVPLSLPSCIGAFIMLGGIPEIISPSENFVVPSQPQNVVFKWNMTSPPLNPLTTEYQLKVYEITNDDVDPEVAIANGNVIDHFESDWNRNSFLIYDAAATTLELGKRYVYTVQVRDSERNKVYKNDGLSEPRWFTYGYPSGGKVEMIKPSYSYQFKTKEKRHFKWNIPDNKGHLHNL